MIEYLKAWEAENMIRRLERENRDLRIENAILNSTPFKSIYSLFPSGDLPITKSSNNAINVSTYDTRKDGTKGYYTILNSRDDVINKEQLLRMFYMLKDTPIESIQLIGCILYVNLCPDDSVKRFADLFAGTHYRKRKVRDFLIYHKRVDGERSLVIKKKSCNYKSGILSKHENKWNNIPSITDKSVQAFLDMYVNESILINDGITNELTLEV